MNNVVFKQLYYSSVVCTLRNVFLNGEVNSIQIFGLEKSTINGDVSNVIDNQSITKTIFNGDVSDCYFDEVHHCTFNGDIKNSYIVVSIYHCTYGKNINQLQQLCTSAYSGVDYSYCTFGDNLESLTINNTAYVHNTNVGNEIGNTTFAIESDTTYLKDGTTTVILD